MSARVRGLYLLILVARCFLLVQLRDDEGCGNAGTPAHGRATVLKSSFPVGYRIQFECEQGFLMIGNPVRKCLENGTWSGQVPFCVLPSPSTKFSQSAISSCASHFSRTVDGDDETCVNVYINGSRTWWAMSLAQLPNITILEVLVKGEVPTDKSTLIGPLQFHLSDIMLDYSDYSHLRCGRKKHKYPKVRWQKYSLRLEPSRQKGRYLYLRSSSPATFSYLRICEVIFITKEHSRLFCGDPEVPLKGIADRSERHIASYQCQHNYELVGPSVRTCDDNSVWSRPLPRCVLKFTDTLTGENVSGPYLYIGDYWHGTSSSVITNFSSVSETLFNDTYCGSVVLDELPFTNTNQYDLTTSSRRNSRLPSCSSSSDRRASLRSNSPSKRISFSRVSSGSRDKQPLEMPRVYSNGSMQFPEGAHIYSEIYEDPPTPVARRSALLNNSSPVVLNPVYLEPIDASDRKALAIYTEPYGTVQI
uniref:Sushi domain-containing protein n=1 Tax=Strigamia maritima TaxID=126957 RepID=T1JB42_STRMM